MITEGVWSHYGQWGLVAIWVVMYGLFLAFTPFYKKSQRKPASAYLAFVIAMAFEMFGIPMSMYFITWAFGITLPRGVFWDHTLGQVIGYWGMYVGVAVSLIGMALVISGLRAIYKHYWSKEEGKGKLVTAGIYRFIRHPQYTGFLLITFGMMAEWATISLLLMWPVLIVLYYRLALREERDMRLEFGPVYDEYCRTSGMFLPRLLPAGPRRAEQQL